MKVVTSIWKSQKISRMAERNGAVTIPAMVIRTRGVTSTNVTVNVKKSSTVHVKNCEEQELLL